MPGAIVSDMDMVEIVACVEALVEALVECLLPSIAYRGVVLFRLALIALGIVSLVLL